ncbi:MAG: GyrI-like domain-containing protein [Anaerolineaceae bacterium]|nr:GyrI-like domain-containing protein [Anaerolineaceae bacterium]
MVNHRSVTRPAFKVAGKKTWIGGQENEAFGLFWEQCRQDGLFDALTQVAGMQPGAQTGGVTLGVSLVADDPANRAFYYLIGVELPEDGDASGLDLYEVPATQWEVFECRGPVPQSIVEAEMYAFMEWLPASGMQHAAAPEMEVYPDGESSDNYVCEFWLPVRKALTRQEA